MINSEPVGSTARPPWWRTGLYVLATGLFGLISVVFSPLSMATQQTPSGTAALVAFVAMLAGVGLPVILFWRHRAPFLAALVPAGVSLVLPIGNALPFVGLAALLARRRGPAVWWATAFVALTSTWVVFADVRAQPRGASFWKMWLGPQPSEPTQRFDLSGVEIAVVLVLGLGLAIGTGLLVRWRRAAASAQEEVRVERATSDRLGDEAARRQERERIAREVHDAMGHRLSLLNLHAGALEANSTDDPQVAQSAHLVRESASAAMADLRSLLDLLRDPLDNELPPVPLTELATVVQESFGAGQPLSSSIFVTDAETAGPSLTRAVYRIVQEVLTNARKHAPGQHVWLTVNGSPAAGLSIDARNRRVGGASGGPPGTSRGLAGIAERAQLLGGVARYGLDGEWFRVHVDLPWRTE